MQDGFIESFNGSFRDECLNLHWFLSLRDAREKIEKLAGGLQPGAAYSALGNLTPSGSVSRGKRVGENSLATITSEV